MNLMQRVAAIFGVAFLVGGLLGFTVTGFAMPTLHDSMEHAPRLFGVFPLNVTHNLVHIAFGMWGLLAARGQRPAMTYALVSGVLYALLAGVGAFWPTMVDIVPMGGYDIGLHLAIAIALIGCAVYSMTTESHATVPLSAGDAGP